VIILDDQQVYGKGVADVFEAKAKELGINVMDHQGIDAKASDYRALATTINSKNPDMVYFGGIVDNNAGQLLKDIKSVGYAGKFMGPDGINTATMITGAGAENAEGIYTTQAGTPESQLGPLGKGFLDKYKAKYGGAPEAYGIYGYDAAGVALAALNKVCSKDRSAIRDAVFATKDYDGALGKFSIDENGDTTLATVVGYQVKEGALVSVTVYQDGAWKDRAQ
jgi:branched-chain amino acid transport system substrate-binding protein